MALQGLPSAYRMAGSSGLRFKSDSKVKGAVIGIDLGTTNSCVAIMEGKQAKVIQFINYRASIMNFFEIFNTLPLNKRMLLIPLKSFPHLSPEGHRKRRGFSNNPVSRSFHRRR